MLIRKLRRDAWHVRWQALAAVLVGAMGVANLVMSRTTLESLDASRQRYYLQYAFADVFADLKRAPEQLASRLRDIPGVAAAETRVVAYGRAELPDYAEPIQIQAISLPEFGEARLNRLHLRSGHVPPSTTHDAVVVSDAFAQAHGLQPGDGVVLTLHGRRRTFRIAGIGASPEFVAQLAPQAVFPDSERFAIVWMPRPVLAAAMDMDGAFNGVTFALAPHAQVDAVLRDIDRILAKRGGIGAITRADQRSHRYLSEELRQLGTMARIFPAVFLAVSAFVLYVTLSRLVAGQREQIGTLKAFGYGRVQLAAHYMGFGALVGLGSTALGLALGARLGTLLAELYRTFYRLPFLDFTLSASVLGLAVLVSLGSALLGCAIPVLRAARLPPAEAMRVDAPSLHTGRWARSTSRWRALSQAHRLIARNILRRPVRSALTLIGLAAGTAVMMMGRFQNDAIDRMVEQQFQRAQRHDVEVGFVEPQGPRALHEIARLPGVRAVEPLRGSPVIVRHRAARYRTSIVGIAPNARLRRQLDATGEPIVPPLRGVLVTNYLADLLGARLGDELEFEVLTGKQRPLRLTLAGTVDEPFGAQAYLPISALDTLLGEGERVSGATLAVDADALPSLFGAFERRPAIATVSQRVVGIRNFYESMANTILTFTLIATLFGATITAGVIYSSARVALSERARDLASLRILGFTQTEVGYLLLGELALLTVLAVPLGFLFGHGLIELLVQGFNSDLFRIPHYVSVHTYGIAGLATLATALLVALLIWRDVQRLDLIGVLKARD